MEATRLKPPCKVTQAFRAQKDESRSENNSRRPQVRDRQEKASGHATMSQNERRMKCALKGRRNLQPWQKSTANSRNTALQAARTAKTSLRRQPLRCAKDKRRKSTRRATHGARSRKGWHIWQELSARAPRRNSPEAKVMDEKKRIAYGARNSGESGL